MECARKWYVVYCKHLNENKVEIKLLQLGFEVYCPKYITIRQWSDRKKKIKRPLIPRVLFIKTSESQLNKIYEVSGVTNVLKQDGKPAIVKEQEIKNLKVYLSGQDVDISNAFDFFPDQEVEVIDGPFKGIVAKAKNEQGKFKLLIEVSNLSINFTLEISKNKVVSKKQLQHIVN